MDFLRKFVTNCALAEGFEPVSISELQEETKEGISIQMNHVRGGVMIQQMYYGQLESD